MTAARSAFVLPTKSNSQRKWCTCHYSKHGILKGSTHETNDKIDGHRPNSVQNEGVGTMNNGRKK